MLEPAIGEALVRSDRHIAITGSSGWIGLATLDLLHQALGDSFATRVSCYGSSSRMLDLGGGRHVPQRTLADLASLKAKRVWLLHFAFQAKDRAEAMSADDYRAANQAISDTVAEALDRIDAEAVFVASSGAATRADDPEASPAMRLYGRMKRDDEARFAAWAQARGTRAVIARIFNITGPYINKHQAYAMAGFIIDALASRPVTVLAPRRVVRSYVAIRELMSLVFALLDAAPDHVTRFDSGGEALELGDVAAIVATVLGAPGAERAAISDSGIDRYAGDAAAYRTLLARHGVEPVALDRQIIETARYLGASIG